MEQFRQACLRVIVLLAVALLGCGPAVGEEPARRPLRKPTMADTVRASVYADNWFSLYVNGELVAVDSIAFLPHNVVAVDILPKYPLTIAGMAQFIWSDDLRLDNTVLFRRVIEAPPDGRGQNRRGPPERGR